MAALRRSARINTAPSRPAVSESLLADDSDDDRAKEEPVRKRKKAAPSVGEEEKPVKRVTHRRGKLADLPNMPLDILYEVSPPFVPRVA